MDRMNGQNLTKFCMHIIIDKIYIGIVKHYFFCKFATKLRPLISIRNFSLNILRMNAQNLTKFCLHIKASYKWLSKYELEKKIQKMGDCPSSNFIHFRC